VRELRESEACDDVLWLEGRCISIGQTVSFWPFIDIMREYLGISGEDSEKQITDKLIGSMQDLFGKEADNIIPYVGHMLSVKLSEKYQEFIRYAAPEQIRHQTLLRVRDVFVALARRKPLILVLEDLHWADDLSLDLLWILMDELIAAPMVILCVHRPEQEHRSWQIDTFASSKHIELYTRIWLRPLTAEQSHEMVRSLLDIDNLPADVENSILHKAEGNPFFVEEVVRWMMEHDFIFRENDRWKAKPEVSELVVPDTVQSLILSRIDRLQDEVKYILQCASVIGRVFQHRLLDYISHQGEELEQNISQLESNQLVYKEKIIPELEYAFKHALTQETTYHGLLTRQRNAFHELVGQGIEKLYQEQLEEYYEQLAYHYSKSSNREKALDYLIRAGQKASGRYANDDALRYYHDALDLVETVEEQDRVLELRGKLYLSLYRGKEAVSDYQTLLDHAQETGDLKAEFEATLGLASGYYSVAFDDAESIPTTQNLYQQAYDLACELGDKSVIARALNPTVHLMDFSPEYREQATANVEEALKLSQEILNEDIIIDSRISRIRVYQNRGDTAEEGEELVKLLKARNDMIKLKELYFQLTIVNINLGNFYRVVECSELAIQLAKELGVLSIQYSTRKAFAFLKLGFYDEAWKALQQEIMDEEHKQGRAFGELGIGAYFLELMAYDRAIEILRDVIQQGKAIGRKWICGWAGDELIRAYTRAGQCEGANLDDIIHRIADKLMRIPADVMAEVALSAGRLDEAMEHVNRACLKAKELTQYTNYVSHGELKVRILLEMNKVKEALNLIDELLQMAQEMEYQPMIWRIRASKARSHEILGEVDNAAEEYMKSATIIHKLADTISQEDLKKNFLANPIIASILAQA